MSEWRFAEPPNVAVFVTSRVVSREASVTYVQHDADDGAWQFHDHVGLSPDNAKIVSLRQVIELDPTIGDLHDLPLGWCAHREDASTPWVRSQLLE